MAEIQKKTLEELRAEAKELDKQREELKKQIEAAREERLIVEQNKVEEKIDVLTDEQKSFILSLMKHDRTSCNDNHVINGRWSSHDGDGFRCRKCMLIEMFNGEHGGVYDFDIEVNINKVTV